MGVTRECGNSALNLLAARGVPHLLEVSSKLLAGGADLDIQNHLGQTALPVAVESRSRSLLPLLLKAGAYLEKKTVECRTALWRAL